MNYNQNRSVETTLDLRDFLWKLVGQWKAALIITIILGLVLSGALQALRMHRYNKAVANEKKEAETAITQLPDVNDSTREEQILSTLSTTDRIKVEGAIRQTVMIKNLDNYMLNSNIMNVDPGNIDTINLQYYLKRDVGSMSEYANAILQGYYYFINSDDFIQGIITDLNLDIEARYLRESIQVFKSNDHEGDYGMYICLKIFKPEGTDLEKLEPVVTQLLKNFSITLSSDVVKHYINLSYSEELYETSNQLLWDKINFTNSLVNAKNSLSNTIAGFNDSQRSAYEAVVDDTNDAESYVDNKTSAAKPRFSAKLFVIGWFGAIVLYVFMYALYVLFKKRLNSSDTLSSSYGIRVFGDVYYPEENAGLKKLFRSKFVNKLYHKGLLNQEKQMAKISSSIDAAVTGKEENGLTLLITAEDIGILNVLADKVGEAVKAAGKTVDMIDAANGVIDEKALSKIESAVLVADSGTRIDDVNEVLDLCRYYDVDMLGAVYTEAV